MNNEEQKNQIEGQILEAIKSGEVKMRPKWHFILKAVLLATGVILVLVMLLYLISFMIFTLRQTGVWFEPGFGSQGWFAFFRSLPWLLVALSLVFIVVLEILVRRYSFAYRKPLLYSLFTILLVIMGGGLAAAPLHQELFRSARENRLPFAGPFYRGYGLQRFENVHRGIVIEVMTDGFIMEELGGATSAVMFAIPPRPTWRIGIERGDLVVVFGNQIGPVIQAYGVQEIEE